MKITVGNSMCKLEGYTVDLLATLRKTLSYEDTKLKMHLTQQTKFMYMNRGKLVALLKQAPNGQKKSITDRLNRLSRQIKDHKKKLAGARHFLLDRKGAFPTGLLYLVEETLVKQGVLYDLQDARIAPRMPQVKLSMNLGGAVPYPEQIAAGEAAKACGRGIIVAPTGVGKSLIAALVIERLGVPTLVVVPGLGLKAQVMAGLRRVFGDTLVGPLINGKKKYFITIENIDALPDHPVEGFDCIIVDEFHRSGAEKYQARNRRCWDGIYYRFGLTATPFRTRSEERLLLESVLSKVIYKIPYQVAVDNGYIVPMEAYYVEVPILDGYKDRNKKYQTVYRELVVERDDRNELIAGMVATLAEQGVSILILTKQIEHGNTLRRMLATHGLDIPFAEGANEHNEALVDDFNASGKGCMIGTVGVLGEGIDTKPCEWVFLAGGGKSRVQFMQNLGRAFRRYGNKQSCKIVMIRDQTNHWLEEHFQACCSYLKNEFGVTAEKLDL